MAALSKHSVRLTPLIKRRVFPDLPGVPRGVALGWAQLTSGEGATVSIGLFIGHDRFSQIALADGNGRVFVTSDPHADTHDMKPRFMLVKEEELDAVDGARFGAKARPPSAVTGASTGESAGTVRAFQGGIVERDATGRMTWLASWLKTGNRYTWSRCAPRCLPRCGSVWSTVTPSPSPSSPHTCCPKCGGCSSGSDREHLPSPQP